jgi:hypothetical protein
LATEETGKILAERIDAVFKPLIGHVANHDHSALGPLSHTAKVEVIELCLPSVPSRERAEQGERRVQAYPVALCGIGHNAEPFGREVLHGLSTSWQLRTKACRFARIHSVMPSDYTWFPQSASPRNLLETQALTSATNVAHWFPSATGEMAKITLPRLTYRASS